MKDLKKDIEEQQAEVDVLIDSLNNEIAQLRDASDYRIVVSKSNGCYQYYRIDATTGRRSYIKADELESAMKAAQLEYDRIVIEKLCKIRKSLSSYLNRCDFKDVYRVYIKMPEGRKRLVTPIFDPDESYVKKWKEVTYDPMPFEDENDFYSDGGVRVRSKSELIIANMLERYGIPYRYEYPIRLKGRGNARPDFTCLNVRTRQEYIWEHFGMMDNIPYANKNVEKINAYGQNGFYAGVNFIMTFETSQHAISSGLIKNNIEQYLL